MSIHAIDKNMHIENVVIDYRDRPEGSESKLNTYSDGFKVLMTIARLYRTYRPLGFFSIVSLLFAIIALALFIPVSIDYMRTGLVARFPTLIVSGFIMLAAIISFFSGLVLHTIGQKNRQDFEMNLIQASREKAQKSDR